MEYYSTIKSIEVAIHAPSQMNLENILISKRIQAQKASYLLCDFIRTRYLEKASLWKQKVD